MSAFHQSDGNLFAQKVLGTASYFYRKMEVEATLNVTII